MVEITSLLLLCRSSVCLSVVCGWWHFVCVCFCIHLLATTDTPISKPTPLYGKPSWWGEDEDAAHKKQNRGGKMPEAESPGQKILSYICIHVFVFLLLFFYLFFFLCIYKVIYICANWSLIVMISFCVALLSDALCWSLLDDVKPKAGPWMPVVEWLPGQWAVPVCLVMDYDPISSQRGVEEWLFSLYCPNWNRLPLSPCIGYIQKTNWTISFSA